MDQNRNAPFTMAPDDEVSPNSQYTLLPLASPQLDIASEWPDNLHQARGNVYDGPRLLPSIHAAVAAATSMTSDLTHEDGENNPRTNYPIHGHYGGSSSSHPLSLFHQTHTDAPFTRYNPNSIDVQRHDLFPRSQLNHHTTVERTIPPPIPYLPKRLPFRTDPNQRPMGYHLDPQERRGTWNSLLGAGVLQGPFQLPRMLDMARHPVGFNQPPLGGIHGLASYASLTLNHVPEHRVDPSVSKAARTRRIASRRKIKALQLKRDGPEPQGKKILPVSPKTPRTPAKSLKISKRRLANRASVQKCRTKMKDRLDKLHKERDALFEETKILANLKKTILEERWQSFMRQEFLTKFGLREEDVADAVKNRTRGNGSPRIPTPGHAYHSNPNNGNQIRNIIRNKDRTPKAQGDKKDARLNRRQRRDMVRGEEPSRAFVGLDTVGKERRIFRMEGLLSVTRNLAVDSESQNMRRTGTGINASLKVDSGHAEENEEERSSNIVRRSGCSVPLTGLRSKPFPASKRGR